jgi:hypothetical protein
MVAHGRISCVNSGRGGGRLSRRRTPTALDEIYIEWCETRNSFVFNCLGGWDGGASGRALVVSTPPKKSENTSCVSGSQAVILDPLAPLCLLQRDRPLLRPMASELDRSGAHSGGRSPASRKSLRRKLSRGLITSSGEPVAELARVAQSEVLPPAESQYR